MLGMSAVCSCEIALSFDDAPWGQGAVFSGPERTKTLIAKLDSLGIDEVVFFCTTERLEYHSGRERLEAYAEAGHLLANHTHTHPDISVGAGEYIADVRTADSLLRPMAGFVPWFRYPYLHEGATVALRDSVRDSLAEIGYVNGYVTVDNYDWFLDRMYRGATREGKQVNIDSLRDLYVEVLWSGIQFYDKMAQATLGRSPKHVLLLHENDLAALIIGDLVGKIRAEGWTIISPKEAYGDPIAKHTPDVLVNSQGRIVAIAVENEYDGPLRHPTESNAYMDSLVTARNVLK